MDDTPRSALGGRAPIHLSAVSQLHVLLHVAYFLSYHTVGYRDPTIVRVYSGRNRVVGSTPFLAQRSIIYHS